MALDMRRRPTSVADFGQEMVPLRAMMDRLLESALAPSLAWGGGNGSAAFGANVFEDANGYHVQCYLPGIDPQAVEITAHQDTLTVSGEYRPVVAEGWKPIHQEVGAGRFYRQFSLGSQVEAGRAEATYDNGVLTITLPKAEMARTKQIRIKPIGE